MNIDYFVDRFQHLLWLVLPKQKIIVAEEEIRFVILPRWLLIGGSNSKTVFVDAKCLTHRKNNLLAIFVTKRKSKKETFRYTIYHEHIEALYNLGILRRSKEFQTDINRAWSSMGKEADFLQKKFEDFLAKNQDTGHIVALIMELALARREMSELQWRFYLEDVIKNRL